MNVKIISLAFSISFLLLSACSNNVFDQFPQSVEESVLAPEDATSDHYSLKMDRSSVDFLPIRGDFIHSTKRKDVQEEMTAVFTGDSPQPKMVDIPHSVLVPAGLAWVGCDESRPDEYGEPCRPDQTPYHQVFISAFYIDKTEVSFAHYRKCVDAGVCPISRFDTITALNSDRQPVVGISWTDADIYCRWKGGRLPTEAEWEKAARGPDGLVYPWGDLWEPEICNWDDNGAYDGYTRPSPVGAFKENASIYGALNMTGNVWEWVSDYYDPDYYQYGDSVNPKGPDEGELHLLKGGAWKWDYWETRLRTYYRSAKPGYGFSDHVGFRCVSDENNTD